MSDSEYEYEEETSYVILDVGSQVTTEFIEKTAKTPNSGCRMLGLEQGKPFLQIGNITFEGTVDETIGTHLLFEVEEKKVETAGLLPLLSSIRADNDEETPKKYTLKYDSKTENIVKMDSVNFQRKETVSEPVIDDEEKKDDGSTLTQIL